MKHKKNTFAFLLALVVLASTAAAVLGASGGGQALQAAQQKGTATKEETAAAEEMQAELQAMEDADHQRRSVISKRLEQEAGGEALTKYQQMVLALDASVENPIVYNEILYNYEYLKKVHHLTAEELDYLSELLIEGLDPQDVLEICYFWTETNEPIRIVREMYAQRQYYQGRTWVENAFNRVTDNKCGVLNREDVDEYMRQGLTAEDIDVANRLCRKGALTIQEILELRREGKTFAELTAQINGVEASELPEAAIRRPMAAAAEMDLPAEQGSAAEEADAVSESREPISPETVLTAERLSERMGEPLQTYYAQALQGEDLADLEERADMDLQEEICRELKQAGVYKTYTPEEREEYLAKGEEQHA